MYFLVIILSVVSPKHSQHSKSTMSWTELGIGKKQMLLCSINNITAGSRVGARGLNNRLA